MIQKLYRIASAFPSLAMTTEGYNSKAWHRKEDGQHGAGMTSDRKEKSVTWPEHDIGEKNDVPKLAQTWQKKGVGIKT